MTDAVLPSAVQEATNVRARLRARRNNADLRLRLYGVAAISSAIGLLAILLVTLGIGGYAAFVQTHIRVDFPISAALVDPADPAAGNWRAVVSEGVGALLPAAESPAQARQIAQILTSNTQFFVRNAVVANPSVIGGTLTLDVPAADIFDQLNKGTIRRETPEENRRVTDQQIAWFDALAEQGRVTTPFNWGLFFNADSRFPEIAGLAGAITGSFYALLVCFCGPH
jgi:phosphate transport system permease protein